jgi:hypothetical protein
MTMMMVWEKRGVHAGGRGHQQEVVGGDEAHLYNVSSLRTPQRRIAGDSRERRERGREKTAGGNMVGEVGVEKENSLEAY